MSEIGSRFTLMNHVEARDPQYDPDDDIEWYCRKPPSSREVGDGKSGGECQCYPMHGNPLPKDILFKALDLIRFTDHDDRIPRLEDERGTGIDRVLPLAGDGKDGHPRL